ncbi:hypothetical protein BKA70DRAFT_1293831 [Coprinopsis sp. MPI-PUGE-AT-0042]|nr:hypothetical protein BKA70DRAFT_1293831 [Coprinopsis sp. MPI-PUGE-AT-0042]
MTLFIEHHGFKPYLSAFILVLLDDWLSSGSSVDVVLCSSLRVWLCTSTKPRHSLNTVAFSYACPPPFSCV